MDDKVILLVEDNADDEALTLRALKRNNIKNDVVVAHDGVEALDYLLGAGGPAGRPPPPPPRPGPSRRAPPSTRARTVGLAARVPRIPPSRHVVHVMQLVIRRTRPPPSHYRG